MKSLRWAFAAVLALSGTGAQAAEAGDPAIGFRLPEFRSGEIVDLQDHAGRVVYLDFWASWCGPCRKSFPFYDDLHKRLGGDRFTIIAVNLDENPDDALGFLERNPVGFTVVLDPSAETASQWQVAAMPSSYLIGPDQLVHKAWVGFRAPHEEEIEHAVQALLSP